MVPIQLTIKNFLSYKDEQVINFENYPIIGLSGENGHGKSALLDSLTWVLWSFARKPQLTTKSDQSLVFLGKKEMFVSLIFKSSNTIYSVKRSIKISGAKTISELTFEVKDETGEWILLNGSSQKETQDRINQEIGYDYDMFLNTCYVKQGNSNEFSKKTPYERKEILCKLFSINKLEEIRERVQEDIRVINQILVKVELEKEYYDEKLKGNSSIDSQKGELESKKIQYKGLLEELKKIKEEKDSVLKKLYVSKKCLLCSSNIGQNYEQYIENCKELNIALLQQDGKEEYIDLERKLNELNELVYQKQTEVQQIYDALLVLNTHLSISEKEHAVFSVKKKDCEALILQKKQDLLIKHNFSSILGKDGMQAMLIDRIIPLLSDEANSILGVLTGGKCFLEICSVRDLKNGKTKETLDILVSDYVGKRPYEFYSGGEAFKIDIALRIALSKVSMYHSGKKLETLIIDEGFGSQDDISIDRFMEILDLLKNEFEKIIVVSHLSVIKEMLPVHFIVQKTNQGSHVSVIEYE